MARKLLCLSATFLDGVLALQVDTALNKSYSVYKQKVNSPQVQDFSDTLSSTKAAVTKQFKDSISLVQDKGLTGTFTVAKQKAFALADESIILAKRGGDSST